MTYNGRFFKSCGMLKITLFFTFSCLAVSSQAQNLVLNGSVRSTGNEAVPYATVMLHVAADSSLAKVEMSDGNGNFRLRGLAANQYYLAIQSMGYRTHTSAAFELNENTTLPIVALQPATENLDEVTVQATKATLEVLPDKTVFNVSSSLAATGTNGIELLRKAPGLVIDNNDNIILEGKSGVQFYVNGKPLQLAGEDLSNYLKNLQADQIEAIELITQPSSKYDAAGSAGIVNIRLKKDLRFGTNGTLTSGYTYGKYGRWNNSLSLNHRNRKLNFYGNYGNNLYKYYNFIDLYRQQAGIIYDSRSATVAEGLSQNLQAGMDYFATSRSTFGITATGSLRKDDPVNNGRTIISFEGADTVQKILVSQNVTDVFNRNLFLNANYRFEDTSGHSLSLDLDYGIYEANRDSYQPNAYYSGNEEVLLLERNYRMNTPLQIHIMSAKTDYEFTVLETVTGVGAKISKVSTDNRFEFYNVSGNSTTFNNDRSNNFGYEEQVSAGYVNLARSFNKVKVQLGLRAEHTLSEGLLSYFNNNNDSLVAREYLDWFPSGGVTYDLNKSNNLSLTYSRRITRPNYEHLNPFEYVLDELSFRKGNPFLQPQYTNNLRLGHTFKYTLNTALTYSYVQDFFAQVTDTIGGNRNYLTTRNVADQQVISLSVSYPFKVKEWWEVYLSVNAYQSIFTANAPEFVPIERKTLSLYGQNTLKLPGEWSLQVSGWFNTPSIWGGTFRTKSMGSLDLSLQKRFLDDKLSLRLAFRDILYTTPWVADVEYSALTTHGRGGHDSRQVSLSLSYNFGNQKLKAVKLREGGLDQESDRLE